MNVVSGVKIGVATAGIKTASKPDIAVFECVPTTTMATVFTQNAFAAAPVIVAKQHQQSTTPTLLLINSGNANAGTGDLGIKHCQQCCQTLAELAKVEMQQVLPFSTGVIGEYLPVDKMRPAIERAYQNLDANHWQQAAQAIMTTDTVEKIVSHQVTINNEVITVTGIAKGAGMICPNMATMLAYIATDAGIADNLLQTCLQQAVDQSFHCITVDGDTSTNDACVLMATAQSNVMMDSMDDPAYAILAKVINHLALELAQKIIADAEGATRFVTININQANDLAEAKQLAYAIAHSPLVKTALFAGDPNWGRILAVVGRAGLVALDINQIKIYLDDICVVENGQRATTYEDAQGQAVMAKSDITIRIDLARGKSNWTLWSCDLSYDYVKINAEYRT